MRRLLILTVFMGTLFAHTSLHGQENWTLPDLQVITPENASEIEYLGSLGYGLFPRPTWSPNSQIVIFDTTAGLWIYHLDNPSNPIHQPDLSNVLGFTADGTAFYANNIWGQTSLVELETLERTFPVVPPNNPRAPEPPPLGEWTINSPDGRYRVNEIPSNFDLETTFQREIVYQILDATTNEVVTEVTGIDRFSFYSYSGYPFIPRFVDSGFLYIKSDNTLWRWNPITSRENLLIDHILDNMISPNGHFIALYHLPATLSAEVPCSVWAINEIEAVLLIEQTFPGADPWSSFAVNPNGQEIAVGGSNYNIRRWDLLNRGQTFSEDRPLGEHNELWISNLDYSPDGEWLADCRHSIGYWSICDLWETATGANRASIDFPNNIVISLAFHPTEHLIAFGLEDGTIRFWEIATLLANGEKNDFTRPDRIFVGHGGAVLDLAFSANGNRLVSASKDNTVWVWDWERGWGSYSYSEFSKAVNAVDISPDGRYIAAGSEDGTVRLWDFDAAPDADAPAPLMVQNDDGRHDVSVADVTFSPDGRLVAGAYVEDGVYIWDTLTRTQLAHIPQPEWTYYCCKAYPLIAFNPQGTLLIEVISASGEVQLWGVPQ